MKIIAPVLVFLFLFAACANNTLDSTAETRVSESKATQHSYEVSAPFTWGGGTSVTRVKHLYFSEQPDLSALQDAKQNGVTAVINLRPLLESDWDEKKAVQDLGMSYLNVPISKKSRSFDKNSITRIDEFVQAQKGQPVLLHCSSGNRAASWLAIHLAEKHGLQNSDAIETAKSAGLAGKNIQRVYKYLEQNKSNK